MSPAIMNGIFIEKADDGHKLRSNIDFCVPRVNSVFKGDDLLTHLGPLIWSIVPDHLKELSSLNSFKAEIKNWNPNNCPCRLCKDYIQGIGYVNLSC